MIRKASKQDLSRIAEIIVFGKRVAYRPIFQNDKFSFNEMQVINVLEEFEGNEAILDNMRVYDDGIVKGIINYKITEAELEICDFYVEPFFKGCGIGRALIQYVIEEAKQNGMKRIFLWVIKENLQARKFYEANSFVATGETCLIEGTDKLDMCYEMRV